ncbi:hypothetical protein RSPO_m00025 (plasmid) [Ralstonia solanacearum Po82]|uniref:Uncharacterized protein n=1 Tax=Ralstonia solanacearum (strain Po82) TaxID=1031711 RepID=F6G7Z0_RALS8|nr:hypothetical protein RSPO_m00025 [Ralstonia solanacearum Po82]
MRQAVFCWTLTTCDTGFQAMPATGPIGLAAPGTARYVEGTGARRQHGPSRHRATTGMKTCALKPVSCRSCSQP